MRRTVLGSMEATCGKRDANSMTGRIDRIVQS